MSSARTKPGEGCQQGAHHTHPTRGNNLNRAATRSYVEVVQGVAPTSGLPTMATSPPHNTRHSAHPCAPTHPSARGAPALPRSSTYSTHRATQHPPQGGTAHSYPTTGNTRHNPHPCAPCVGKGTQHAQQRHEGEGRGFVLHSPKEGLSVGIWRRKVVMCRCEEMTCKRTSQGPTAAVGERFLTAGLGWRLDAPCQRRRQLPSSVWTRRREMKQGKSGGSVSTTDQGNGKGRSGEKLMGTTAYGGKGQGKGKGSREGRIGQGGRGRSQGGEKPMGTTAYGGKGSKGRASEWRSASRRR